MGAREQNRMRVTFLCERVHLRSSRITKPDRPRHLVICLARSIVMRAPDHFIHPVILYQYKMGMPPRNHQAQKRWFQLRIFNIVRGHMPLNMVHTHQRLFCRVGNCLRLRHANQERADQARSVSNADGIDPAKFHFRLF